MMRLKNNHAAHHGVPNFTANNPAAITQGEVGGGTTHESLCKLFVFREKPVTRVDLRRGRNDFRHYSPPAGEGSTCCDNPDTYGLCSSGPDGTHDGVHVQVALAGGSRADAEGLICHLDVDLGTSKRMYEWEHRWFCPFRYYLDQNSSSSFALCGFLQICLLWRQLRSSLSSSSINIYPGTIILY